MNTNLQLLKTKTLKLGTQLPRSLRVVLSNQLWGKDMAKIHVQVGDLETTWDTSRDPLVILLTAEGSDDEADKYVSTLEGNKAVTKVKKSKIDSKK